MSIRLNKLLARRGVGARRKCDTLIQQGAVRVNGRVVREPGLQVEPGRDRITVNGQPLPAAAEARYFVLNKPVGVITTLEDPEGRRTIRDLMPPGPRLFPVGRLDADTSGLLILTNDGELAHHLMHPRYGVTKVYRVRLERAPSPEALRRLAEGVEFEPGVTSAPARVRVLSDEPGDALIQIALHEGRYRQVRRMCEAVGLAVRALHRSAYGPLRLGPVPRGMWRELSAEEVRRLRAASARPRQRGQVGYRSPRAGSDAALRLARRLQGLAGEGAVRRSREEAPRVPPAERTGRPRERRRESSRSERPRPPRGEERPRRRRGFQDGMDRQDSRGAGRPRRRGPRQPASRGAGRPRRRGPRQPASRGTGQNARRLGRASAGRRRARGPGSSGRR